MPRINQHVTETLSRAIFSKLTAEYSNNGVTLLFRELSEQDYGVDGLLEIFESGNPTGKSSYIQLKSTDDKIEKLVYSDEVSCPGISKSNLYYCDQNNIPIILVYISTVNEEFYFRDMGELKLKTENTVTVRIPIRNNDLDLLVYTINSYYKTKSACTDKIVGLYDRVSDGEHCKVNILNEPLQEGWWLDDKLIKGIEYAWLIKVTEGALIFKPDCLDDPYDSTPDFRYEKYEQYGQNPLMRFSWSMSMLEHEPKEWFYVVDMEVDGEYEQMVNIHPLKQFLLEKNPDLFNRIEEFRE